MESRIRYVRKKIGNNLTQEEFAKRIGIKQSTVTSYETGNRVPTSAVITSICREFNVCEEWLRTGEGPIEAPAAVDPLELMARQHNLGPGGKALLKVATRVIEELDEKSASALLDQLIVLMQDAAAERDGSGVSKPSAESSDSSSAGRSSVG